MKKAPGRKSDVRVEITEPDGRFDKGADAVFSEDLLKALHQLERAAPKAESELPQLLKLVGRTKKLERRRMIRDLVFFLAAASVIVAGQVFSFTVRPQVFVMLLVIVSALSLVITPVVLLLYQRTRGKLG